MASFVRTLLRSSSTATGGAASEPSTPNKSLETQRSARTPSFNDFSCCCADDVADELGGKARGDGDIPSTPPSPITPPPWKQGSAEEFSPSSLTRRISLDAFRSAGDMKRILFPRSSEDWSSKSPAIPIPHAASKEKKLRDDARSKRERRIDYYEYCELIRSTSL